jgi:hypothetical protein
VNRVLRISRAVLRWLPASGSEAAEDDEGEAALARVRSLEPQCRENFIGICWLAQVSNTSCFQSPGQGRAKGPRLVCHWSLELGQALVAVRSIWWRILRQGLLVLEVER